jgi:tRNA threonylcarbamoyladenosine biosynthesis protein TsaE
MKKEYVYDLNSLKNVVVEVRLLLPQYKFFAFSGSLGSGKTTLIRALLQSLGVVGVIGSPTFNYVNIYKNNAHQVFHHFDLYRIGSIEEFIYAGFDEYLDVPNSWSFIEWPEFIMPLIEHNVCRIHIDYCGFGEKNKQRKLVVCQRDK